MAMTVTELKSKYDAAQEKVEKRLNTINKIIKKLNLNSTKSESLMNDYRLKAQELKDESYMRVSEARAIVNKYLQEKPTRDVNGNWSSDNYDYNSKLEQLVDNLTKLYEIEKIAANWKIKLDIQTNKDNAPKIEVLWTFLTNWENRARDWYLENSKYYETKCNEFHKIAVNFLNEINYFELESREEKLAAVEEFNKYMLENYHIKRRYRWGCFDLDDWLDAQPIDTITRQLTTIRFKSSERDMEYRYDQYFGSQAHKGEYVLTNFDLEKLNKILRDEKQRKYEDLVNRVTAIVGEITNVTNLKIGNQQGELNGFVEGTQGKCSVQTIGAGGYNIQCFHYRVLIHKIN